MELSPKVTEGEFIVKSQVFSSIYVIFLHKILCIAGVRSFFDNLY